MREQRAEHVYIPRRASTTTQTTEQEPPARRREPPASSRHHVGHWAGIHLEDQPQQTYSPRTTSYVDWDEEEEEDHATLQTTRLRSSAIRRDMVPVYTGRYLPADQPREGPRRRPHLILRLGLALSLLFLSWMLLFNGIQVVYLNTGTSFQPIHP
jgi:hypothetical protein